MNTPPRPRARNLQPTLARLPPLSSLRAFVATARHLSFLSAADELHVTSAAIGQQIRQLEDHLGQALFLRNRGQLHLTDAGQALMPGLTEAFDLVLESVARLAGDPESGAIRMSVAPSFAGKWLVPRLAALRRSIPDLEVLLDTSTRLADVAGEDIDCVIRYGKGGYPGLVTSRLFSEAVLPVCSPDFAERHGLHRGPDALIHVPLLHEDGPERDASCPDWKNWLRSAGASARIGDGGIRLNQSSLVLDAALAGQGIGLGKLRLAEADLAAGRLVSPFGVPQPVDFSYFFATSPHKSGLKRVELFRNWLEEETAAIRTISLAAMPERRSVYDRDIIAAE